MKLSQYRFNHILTQLTSSDKLRSNRDALLKMGVIKNPKDQMTAEQMTVAVYMAIVNVDKKRELWIDETIRHPYRDEHGNSFITFFASVLKIGPIAIKRIKFDIHRNEITVTFDDVSRPDQMFKGSKVERQYFEKYVVIEKNTLAHLHAMHMSGNTNK